MAPKKITLLIILLILLLAAGAAAAFYFFYYQPQPAALKEEGQTPPETAPAETLKDFTGQFVKGKVPEGWTVLEHQNGAGSSMLTSGVTYLGLTGLEVKNPGGTTVFKLEGVYGIGGIGGCGIYFKFDDDSSIYYNDVLSTNEEAGREMPTVVDLRGLPYRSLKFFEIRVRRIGTNLYWDVDSDETYFEAACGIQEKILDVGAPQFTISSPGGGTNGIYQFTVLSSASTEDLEKLDAILNSLIVL